MAPERVWPFIGREQLVSDLLERLEAYQGVILGGAAGLGKSSVAREVATALAARRVVVHRVTASPSSAHLPLAPFASLLAGTPSTDVVGAVLQALGADGRSGAGDPVLVVDDLHHLDDASAAVLQQVLLSGHVRLLGTWRTQSKLPAAVMTWRHDAAVVHIDVPRLPDADIILIAESALGGVLDGRSQQSLTTLSAGNPMYARELIEGSISAGALTEHAGVWTFDEETKATPLLEEVVLSRLKPLRTDERNALELLAIGGVLSHPMLQALTGSDVLERLERKHVINLSPAIGVHQAQVDVVHPLYRELTRARLGPLARLRIYRTLATAAAMHHAAVHSEPWQETIRAALWHIRGEVAISPHALLAAARDAATIGDIAVAAELAQVAYQRGGDTNAALLASWCLAQGGQHDAAIEILKDAADHAENDWTRAAMRLRGAEELWWTSRPLDALQYLDESELPPGPWHDLLDAQRGVFAMLQGNLPDASNRCRPLLAHQDKAVRLVATIAMGNVGIWGDRTQESIQIAGAAVAEATTVDGDEVGHFGDPNIFLAIQLVAMLHDGDVAAAAEFAEAAYASIVREPSPQARAWAALMCGQALSIRGELTKACRYLVEAERGWTDVGLPGFAGWCAGGLARAQVELGLLAQATATLQRADHYEMAGFGLNGSQIFYARAWLAVAQGNRSKAASILDSTLDEATRFEQWTHVAETWHEAARLDLLDLLPGLSEWTRPTARLATARFDFVHAYQSGSKAALEAACEGFEHLGAVLYAAEAAVAARGLAKGKEATRLDGIAGRLLAECGHARTPLLAGRSASPLSTRESEIATLAARGLSNRQIASELIVSERTVENHIYRAFIKLGVDNRNELAEALGTK